jgi:polysaccharide deacetylase family protein (PEP-CTERM system associated)
MINILTFDIEDWYNCDFISQDFDWNKFEVRIYAGVEKILAELEKRQLTATFFCLGWIAENHPGVLRSISEQGHEIGVHSYMHELAFRFQGDAFKKDTEKAKKLIEDVIGKNVTSYRAPGFSITQSNICDLYTLAELGFEYDCSLFPASHDYGGFPDYGKAEPSILNLSNGLKLKEFPVSIKKIATTNFVFSGGGYFRLCPYWLIKKWFSESSYNMTYFHPRDFDAGQPMLHSLPIKRKIKSYVGISGAFNKLKMLLDDFDFISIGEADCLVDWNNAGSIIL